MNRAQLLPLMVISLFIPVNAVAVEPLVTVSTVPRSFKAGESVKVHVVIAGGGSFENAKLELRIMDASEVFLSTSQNIGPIGLGQKKSYTFPDTLIAPSAPQGNVLTVGVALLHQDEVFFDEQWSFTFPTAPPPSNVGVRQLIYRCSAGAGRKAAKVVCVYKTPAQIATEGSAKQVTPHP